VEVREELPGDRFADEIQRHFQGIELSPEHQFLQPRRRQFVPATANSRFENNSDGFLEKVEKDCKKSAAEFQIHYEGCPYKHEVQEIPANVKKVLADEHVREV
jgi:hypothetical protein